MNYHILILLFAASGSLFAMDCKREAKTFTVKMLNTSAKQPGEVMVFEPPVLQVCKGDTVQWTSDDFGHNSQSEIIPQGAAPWKGALNESIKVTLSEKGTYIYQCAPHVFLGMVGVIIVETPTPDNEIAPKLNAFYTKYPSAKKRLESYYQQAMQLAYR